MPGLFPWLEKRNAFKTNAMLISVAEARSILGQYTPPLATERIPLAQAAGRVLAEPIIADRDLPPFDRVAMDGIAIHYPAYAAGQRRFPIAWLQAAGAPPRALNDPTHCVEIMTGAALPPGVTTVVRYEDLQREGDAFHLPDGLVDNKNIHARGKDTVVGSQLAGAGQPIGVAAMGMLASCGYATVAVRKPLRAAVIATGNELVAVAAQPAPHQIRMSNVYQLAQLLTTAGVQASCYHYPDDRAVLEEKLTDRLADSDLLVLSGGVSKGKLDFVPEVLATLGVEKLFHGVAQRPGKPLWVGQRAGTLVFGLPGNPVSSLSCLLQFVLPYLAPAPAPPAYACLAEEVTFRPDLSLFQLVQLRSDATDGRLLAYPTPHQGSGDASSLLRSDAFLELPPGRTNYPAGDVFRVFRF